MVSPSTAKSRRLRAALTLKGLTYRAFSAAHGFNERTVKAAVRGERAGKVSQAVIRKIHAL